LLQQNTDLWHVGQDTVDLRMSRRTFARVQQYVPECRVLIDNVEEHVQQAEAQMFPARLQEEEAWAQSVLESVLNTKASLAECQAAIENWEKARFQEGTSAWFQEYHSYDAIVTWYKMVAEEHPNLVRYVTSIGRSYLGLDMPAVHLTASSKSSNPQTKKKKKIYFQCQIHAREWISGAVCMYIVDQMVTLYKSDPEVTGILDSAEIILIPFVNPDGYVYTWAHDRLWRKNRRTVGSQSGRTKPCVGVDINRNFPEGWREVCTRTLRSHFEFTCVISI
jgi:murein tripeptide amidase MpaA